MVITSNLSDEALLNAIYASAKAYSQLIGNEYLIIGKNKASGYFGFQCHFYKKYFMHLLGIQSKTLNAEEFYMKCEEYNQEQGKGIMISDCTPSRNHNRKTINEKCSCCAEMLHIENAKYMKVGLKDKISEFVDFAYAYGNIATLGFQQNGLKFSFPITLIPRSIDEFTSKKYKIIFILQKKIREDKYKKLLVEIKEGIFMEHYMELPEEIKGMIAI